MSRLSDKIKHTARRTYRVRSRIQGSSDRPRLSVNISNRNISAQLIDDSQHKTIVGISTSNIKISGNMTNKAEYIGSEIAKLAKSKKVSKVVLDRGKKIYHGRLKALAEAARKGGLEF